MLHAVERGLGVATVELALDGVSVVVKGLFNAAIFSPAWLLAEGLIGKSEYGEADVELITREIASFTVGWLRCQVSPDALQLTTTEPEEFERVRDAAVGILNTRSHTPVAALGINREVHLPARDEAHYLAIGDALAPKKFWEPLVDLPATRTLTVWDTADVPAQPAQLAPAQAGQPQQQQLNTLGAGPLTAGSVGSSQSGMHVLPALSKGITSAYNTIGSLAALAINLGAQAAAAGVNGVAPGAGAAAGAGISSIGGFVQGLFSQYGKIAVDIANVPSSFMVSNWAGKGASPNASGAAYHPSQQTLATANIAGAATYNISGNYELDHAMDMMKLHDAQQQQGVLANHPAWP